MSHPGSPWHCCVLFPTGSPRGAAGGGWRGGAPGVGGGCKASLALTWREMGLEGDGWGMQAERCRSGRCEGEILSPEAVRGCHCSPELWVPHPRRCPGLQMEPWAA